MKYYNKLFYKQNLYLHFNKKFDKYIIIYKNLGSFSILESFLIIFDRQIVKKMIIKKM
jgi:hypothetical protein